MLAIEVFRPDEMVLVLNQKKNGSSVRKMKQKLQPDNPYFQANDEESEDDFDIE